MTIWRNCWLLKLWTWGLLLAVLTAQPVPAQMLGPVSGAGFSAEDIPLNPQYPELPQRSPRPPHQIESFVEPLSNTDSVIRVIVGQGRLLTLKSNILEPNQPDPLIAIGDPSVVDFEVAGPRHIRLTGFRIGVTDLSILTPDRTNYSFEIHVVADLQILEARLRQLFPDASVKLTHMREHVAVEGQARDARQVSQIIGVVDAYMQSIHNSQMVKSSTQTKTRLAEGTRSNGGGRGGLPPDVENPANEAVPFDAQAEPEAGNLDVQGRALTTRVINLLRVPGPQQVMLKVQVAELNRTAFRSIGFNFITRDGGTSVGTRVGDSIADFTQLFLPTSFPSKTVFGIVDNGDFQFILDALRRNRVLKILAEPNLVAMNGEEASFLAGGEFPVPVPQSGAGGGIPTITVIYKEFGVKLRYKPRINDDESIRLAVTPEVSSIDQSLGIQLQGFNVPALAKRTANTVVEMREGHTLAIAGLLQVELEGNTDKIPGIGDLKYIGPFFSNTSSETVEKELIVLVTPYLVDAARPEELPPLPGAEVREPTDLEVYLYGRIEGKTHCDYRATTRGYHTPPPTEVIQLERKYVRGPFGFSQ